MTGNRRIRASVGARVGIIGGLLLAAVGAGVWTAPPAGATPVVQQVSADTLTDTPTVPYGVHHATEVETDALAEGSTIVSSFQVGRFALHGASAMGWATSTNGGQTWQNGLLPGVSAASPNPNSTYVSVANQSVLYDAAHGTWLIPTVGVVNCANEVPTTASCFGQSAGEHSLLVNTSSDGLNWSQPVVAVTSNVDKPWGVCDNSPSSPFYGTCYVAYGQIDDGERLALVRTTDGGQTWSAPIETTSDQNAYNAIPVVQPDGRLVIVATDAGNGSNGSLLLSFISNDGGATLSDAVTGPNALPAIQYHTPAGGIRAKDKPSVAVDSAGTVYVAWSDCRFRTACAENDIVMATSTDGMNFSAPIRVAEDPATSTDDHFIPGIGVRPGTSGTSAEIGVVNYFYPAANCTSSTCRLDVEFSSSINGGAQWTTTQLNPTPMQLSWLAPTTLGPAVGDYESVTYSQGQAVTVFPLASAPVSGTFDEAENAATMPSAGGSPITSTAGAGQIEEAGGTFPTPFRATVVNPTTGAAVVGAPVTFSAPSTGAGGTFAGGVTSVVTTSNGSGVATAPAFTANGTPGTYTVMAATSGGSTGFQTVNAGPPATVLPLVGTSPLGAPVGTAYPTPATVTVRDVNGVPVSGATVVFAAPSAGASGTFAPPGSGTTATVVTNASGIAVAPTFTANATTGSYVLTVTAGSAVGSVSMTNTSSAPATLTVIGGSGQSATIGTSFSTPLTVTLVDSSGQPYPGAAVTFTAPSARTSATFVATGLTTTTVTTDATGTATVPTAYASSGSGTYTVSVSSGPASASISLTNDAGPPVYVSPWASTTNQSQQVGGAYAQQLKVTVTDAFSNPVVAVPVTFTAPSSGPSGTFAGSGTSATIITNSLGQASSPVLTANQVPGAFQVGVTAASGSGTNPSSVFNLTNTQQPAITSPGTATFGVGIPDSFTVTSTGTPTPSLSEMGALPPGVFFTDAGNGTATIAGTPTMTGTFPLTVSASNGIGPAAQESFDLSVNPLPTVTSIAPTSGSTTGGTTVTITGSGFSEATEVDFGSTPAPAFTVVSDTEVTATAPAGSGSDDVTVTTPSSTSVISTADVFTWVVIPSVTSVSPSTGPAVGGTAVTITGSGFTGATAVDFGTAPATSYRVVSDTQVTATAPESGGTVDVTVTTLGGTSATGVDDQFTYQAAVAPGAPTGLAASLGNGTATLSWSAPASDGGSPLTSYSVSATDTTTSATLPTVVVSGSPPATSTTFTGLTPGDAYSFTVAATNEPGTGPTTSALSVLLPGPFHALPPARICDTRPSAVSGITDQCSGKSLGPAATLIVQVTGNGGVPQGATAVVANITVTDPTTQSYLTAWAAGSPRPLASNLNYSAGQTVPNLVTVPVSSTGALDLRNAAGTTDVIVDVTGYYGPGTVSSPGVGFTPLAPARICDTRSTARSGGPADQCTGETPGVGADPETLAVQVTGNGGVPAAATAVVANITVTDPSTPSYLTAYAQGASRPLASNLNFTSGQTVPNRVIIPLSASGAIDIFNANGSVDVIVDVTGYYSSASTGMFGALPPARICDTRPTSVSGLTDACTGKTVTAAGTLSVPVAGMGGVPTTASAVVANVTVTGTTAGSYLTVYPATSARPLASDLNWTEGETVPNLVVAELGTNGAVDIYNAQGSTDVIIDVAGWFTP